MTRTTETGDVAGKSVTIVRPAAPNVPDLHVFASADVVWVVIAEEPGLSELLAALP